MASKVCQGSSCSVSQAGPPNLSDTSLLSPSIQAATLGDPRRPAEVRKRGAVAMPMPDETISQTILLMAMSQSIFGLMFQVGVGVSSTCVSSCCFVPHLLPVLPALPASCLPACLLPLLQSKPLVWGGLLLTLAGYSHMPFDAPEAKRMMMFVFT